MHEVPPLPDGDRVALLSPASWSEESHVERTVALVESWGLRPYLGRHTRDRCGYLAGTDRDRLADLDEALRDPTVRAIVCLRGGCGSFRLLRMLDTAALAADPVPIVGFSDITALHRLWQATGVPSVHGAAAGERAGLVRSLLVGEEPAPVRSEPERFGAALTTSGAAEGPLAGGNLEMLARSVGVLDVDLSGHVLLLEINRSAGLGMVDRALTQLLDSGALDGVVGVALGELDGFDGYVDRGWSILDVLADRLSRLRVPILAGLPLGHLDDPVPVPLGRWSRLDADAGTLVCDRLTAG